MKILKNFDAKKIAKAKNIILLAIISVFFLALLFFSSAFRAFVSQHPGLIGVLIAVSGEVYFDWKEQSGRHAKWKKFFMALLVVSLAYELYEASESDQKAADSIKLAGQANERAANTESNNLVLQTNVASLNEAVIKLAHQYDLSTNALAEANMRLADTKFELISVSNSLAMNSPTNFPISSVEANGYIVVDIKDAPMFVGLRNRRAVLELLSDEPYWVGGVPMNGRINWVATNRYGSLEVGVEFIADKLRTIGSPAAVTFNNFRTARLNLFPDGPSTYLSDLSFKAVS